MPAGRPRLPIDAEGVFKLAKLGCTNIEIADFFGCSEKTIRNNFSGELKSGRAVWKKSLRRAQTIRAIRDRSDAMLIHLGKHYLGQDSPQPQEEIDEPDIPYDEVDAAIFGRVQQSANSEIKSSRFRENGQ